MTIICVTIFLSISNKEVKMADNPSATTQNKIFKEKTSCILALQRTQVLGGEEYR